MLKLYHSLIFQPISLFTMKNMPLFLSTLKIESTLDICHREKGVIKLLSNNLTMHYSELPQNL